MARLRSKHSRENPPEFEFEELLNNLQDWELSFKEKDKKLRADSFGRGKLDPPQSSHNNSSQRLDNPRINGRHTSGKNFFKQSKYHKTDYLKEYEKLCQLPSTVPYQAGVIDANSEKEMGNEFYKKKKFHEAIDCYSRSIALSPTAVAFANRNMVYIKIKRFQDAEHDCTEALELDYRYIKAYSHRSTARKELGKLKESIDDVEFALRLEPQNQDIKKQYAECKALLEKEIMKKASGALAGSLEGVRREKLEVEKKNGTSFSTGQVSKFVGNDSKV